MRLRDVIERAGAAGLALQAPDGAFPAGHNGPHGHRDTPVRVTAHWLQTLLAAHALTQRPALRDAAARAAAYLGRSAVRPHGATFWCRTSAGKTSCNGLIGQAWAIEALDAAAGSLAESRHRALAREVFELHPFVLAEGLWRIVEIDGRPGPIDRTFNHQVWFAAAGALLDPSPDGAIGQQVHAFLDAAAARHLRVTPAGPIVHRIDGLHSPTGGPPRPRRRLRALLRPWSTLPRAAPAHPLWSTPGFRAALGYVQDDAYLRDLEQNVYGYPYNPVGFEVAFALQVFRPEGAASPRSDAWWVARQLGRTYDPATGLLTRGTGDPRTLAARLYEACRLADLALPSGPGEEPRGRTGGARA